MWHGDGRDDESLGWLEGRSFTTAFVTGNHENYDALRKYPLDEWRGGSIRRTRPTVILLERGQIFNLGGERFFTMGGASSHDIQDGILEPDDPLFKKKCRELDARASLDRVGWEVDYILTHCCSTSVQDELSGGFYQADTLTDFLDKVARRCKFKCHFFGHYHMDRIIQKKYVLLYEQIIRLKL